MGISSAQTEDKIKLFLWFFRWSYFRKLISFTKIDVSEEIAAKFHMTLSCTEIFKLTETNLMRAVKRLSVIGLKCQSLVNTMNKQASSNPLFQSTKAFIQADEMFYIHGFKKLSLKPLWYFK